MEPKLVYLETEQLSHLLTRGSLILCSCILAIVLLSNVLERWALGRAYPKLWEELSRGEYERRRRSFTYFHLGATVMFVLMISGAYPVFNWLVGTAHLADTLIKTPVFNISYGDYMLVLSQIYSAYYLFEVCFRTRFASAISIAHHVGLLIVIQTALALFGKFRTFPEATLEFYMCMVWGSFDIVVELPLYTFMIIWRAKSRNHQLLSRIAYACCVWVFLGAAVETVITVWLLNRSWHRWSLSFRVSLPMVFSLWVMAQIYGGCRIFSMARSQQRLAARQRRGPDQHIEEGDGYHKSHNNQNPTDEPEMIYGTIPDEYPQSSDSPPRAARHQRERETSPAS